MKKSILVIAAVLVCQLVISSLQPMTIHAGTTHEITQIISTSFLSEVSLSKGLVPVIVELKKDPTLDYFKMWKNHSVTLSDELSYRTSIVSYQNKWVKNLVNRGISFQKVGFCTDTINMVSMLIKGSDLEKISLDPTVKKIYDNRFIVKPYRSIMAQTTSVEKVWKGTEGPKATGKDVIVGVIDTGMEVDHSEFTGKVLGGKNFVDGESYRTDPLGHGTHVGGIVGGLGDSSHGKGMAPGVKFFTYKALGPNGGTTDGIMQAMDQAVKDKCQIINMSLGRAGGDDSKNGNPYYSIIKRIVDANVLVVAASGNSGARGKNVPWPAGSPGITEDSLCVAASNDRSARMVYSSRERSILASFNPDLPFSFGEINPTDMVDCSYGKATDFTLKNVSGKIALIKRGPYQHPLSFEEKMLEAKKARAKAVIFIDYQEKTQLIPSLNLGSSLPFICISSADGDFLLDSKKLESSTSLLEIKGLSMADFTSMGITPDGAFKPEITAPGVNIMSSVPKRYGNYAAASGTSMACPSIAGQAALIREVHPKWTVNQIKSAMMNTAYLIMNPTQGKPVTFMLQGAGQSIVERAISTPAFLSPRAFVVENSTDQKITFTVTNATTKDLISKIRVEYFIEEGEVSPVQMELDKQEIKISQSGNVSFSANISIDKTKFLRPRIEGVIWVGELHIPFIILRESSVSDNGKALRNPVSDIFCSTQNVDYNDTTMPVRVNFSFNTGSEQKYEGEVSYNNYGSVKIFVTDPQGLLWDPRPIKEFKQCVIGDYSFVWDKLTASKEYLPNGIFSLKFECSASDDNEIVSKPLIVSNSPQEFTPSLILASPRYVSAESTFSLDLIVPTLTDVKEIEYTLYYDVKKLKIEKIEKADIVTTWDSPTYKTDNIRIKMTGFSAPKEGDNRIKLATIFFTAKGLGPIKLSNKIYLSMSPDRKARALGFLPEVVITKKSFLIGDVNNDKIVDLNDYFLLLKPLDSLYGEPPFVPEYDINQDLKIDQIDLDIILSECGMQL